MTEKWLRATRAWTEARIRAQDPRAVFGSEEFAWARSLEAAWPDVRREAEAVLAERERVVNFDAVLPGQRALYQGAKWKSYFLVAGGRPAPEHAAACPATVRALGRVPGLINAFFSIFGPGTEVPPHRGPFAGILRCHLGVIVPEGDVGIRVNGQGLRWREGECLFFDDSFEHEAWNRTGRDRVVLFIDFHRPLVGPIGLASRGLVWGIGRTKAARAALGAVVDTQVRPR